MPGRSEHLNLYSTFHGPDCQAQTKCLLAGDWGVREAAKTWEHSGESCLPRETCKPAESHCTQARNPLSSLAPTVAPHHRKTKNLFQQDGLEGWIQLLADVLQQERLPKCNGFFQTAEKVPVAQLGHLQAVHLLLKSSRSRQGWRRAQYYAGALLRALFLPC